MRSSESEQAWIGKLRLSNGDFYVQDCGATLVSVCHDWLKMYRSTSYAMQVKAKKVDGLLFIENI